MYFKNAMHPVNRAGNLLVVKKRLIFAGCLTDNNIFNDAKIKNKLGSQKTFYVYRHG